MYVSRCLYCHVIILLCLWRKCVAFCGQHIQFKQFDIDSVFGMWYGVGYAQHIPDLTNKPGEIGCVTIHVSDVTNEVHDDWLGWENPTHRHNWTNPKWESPNNNPWSANPMSGSWLDYRMQRIAKREVPFLSDRRLRVVWDEDGQTEEQIYLFSTMSPGLWKLEQLRPGEQERSSIKLDIWYPDYSTKPPEYIYVLQSTPNSMVLYHCTEGGGTRTFSLVLRRFPARMASWDWYLLRKVLFGFELPHVYRYSAVCAGCVEASSRLCIMVGVVILSILNKVSVCL